MKRYIFIFMLVNFFPQVVKADGLEEKDPCFGVGQHLDWDKLLREGVPPETLISSLVKGDWTYQATYTENKCLEITRVKKQTQNTERLFNFNKNLKTDNGRLGPARIVDVSASDDVIAILLAVPQGYVYVKICKNLDRNDDKYLFMPPAGVGNGPWNVIKFTRELTTFGLHIPILAPGCAIRSLKFTSMDKLAVIVRGHADPVTIDFGGSEILKDGAPIGNTVKSSELYNPSVFPTDLIIQDIQKIDTNDEFRQKLWRDKIEATEGGRGHVMKEMNSKLKGNTAVLEKLQRMDKKAFKLEKE